MTLQDDARRLIGFHVVASDDEDLGTVEEVFYDNRTHHPEFIAVRSSGLFGRKGTLVPLQGSRVSGEQLRVPFDKQRVKDAPDVGTGRDISPGEGEELYRHYGLRSSDVPAQQTGAADTKDAGAKETTDATGTADAAHTADAADTANLTDTDTDTDTAEAADAAGTGTDADAKADTATDTAADAKTDAIEGTATGAPEADAAPADASTGTADPATMGTTGTAASGADTEEIIVTRSEERMHVGTERHEADRIHVLRRVETEDIERSVPISREDVQISREPITDTDRVHATDLGEDEMEIILYEERPVVSTESVPVERVRIKKTTNRSQEIVRGRIRKERVDIMRDRDGGA